MPISDVFIWVTFCRIIFRNHILKEFLKKKMGKFFDLKSLIGSSAVTNFKTRIPEFFLQYFISISKYSAKNKVFKFYGPTLSLNTQSCIKGLLVVRDFCFWATDYETWLKWVSHDFLFSFCTLYHQSKIEYFGYNSSFDKKSSLFLPASSFYIAKMTCLRICIENRDTGVSECQKSWWGQFALPDWNRVVNVIK